METEHLVIGSGIAGMVLALRLARTAKVMLLAKTTLEDNTSRYAQGGIASVLGQDDSFDSHFQDTVRAGAGLCHEEIVQRVVEEGPAAVNELINLGVNFTRQESEYHLSREGGHSKRRVIHADDATGSEIIRALLEQIKANENIDFLENHYVVDLLTTDKYQPNFSKNYCVGCYVANAEDSRISVIRSRFTYLCTGGHGKVYLYTSNPNLATGDGLAMGWRAGCKVANLEFMQFHPTCLYTTYDKHFLISEAVRGEGAQIRNQEGESFLRNPQGALASRDVVAREIDLELKRSGANFVYLDMREIGRTKIEKLFPNITRICSRNGIDVLTDMIPVVPAAHYSCGGLVVNEFGQTNVERLYAIGEVACSGLHGANRLASNSLLEAVVFARIAADHALSLRGRQEPDSISVPPWNDARVAPADERVSLSQSWDEIRRLMWSYVGIVRSDVRLKKALNRITNLRYELDNYYWRYQISPELLEVRNLSQVAWLTVRCAMSRKESRGIHYNIDYPDRDDVFQRKDTVIW